MRTIICLFFMFLSFSHAIADSLPIDLSGGKVPNPKAFFSDSVYEDESLKISIEQTTYHNTNIYLAYVHIEDPSQLRTAPAYSFERDQVEPSDVIAKRVNAVLAINGDYFSYQLQGGSYLIRQGVMYWNEPMRRRDVLLIHDNGDFDIVQCKSNGEPAEFESDWSGIVNSFNFGPGLVIDGKRLDPEYSQNYNDSLVKHRRCAIAQVKKGLLDYICIVTDGPEENENGGLTIQELADFVAALGVDNAYNLDGGNSTVMLFGGRKINAIDQKYLRPISDIIYSATTVGAN